MNEIKTLRFSFLPFVCLFVSHLLLSRFLLHLHIDFYYFHSFFFFLLLCREGDLKKKSNNLVVTKKSSPALIVAMVFPEPFPSR